MGNVEKQDFGKLINLLQEIESIKEIDDKKREKESFNIFSALHRIDDEVRLHSRFIAYLLSPTSNHRKGNLFAEIFIKRILGITDFNMDAYKVYPDEFEKSEYKEIDILLVDDKKKAIILENKTRYSTPDSNYIDKKPGYNGQLERYYNTIHAGKDVNGKPSIHCEDPSIFYLSPNGKLPDKTSLGMLKDENIVKYIHYEKHVVDWLKECIKIKEIQSDEVLKGVLKQYLKIVEVMTNTDISIHERRKLKEKVAENYEIAMYFQNNFKHIKWHTVDDFWGKLRERLEKAYENVKREADKDEITEITHNKRKGCLKITFEKEGHKMYVCYDDKGLTFGNTTLDKWKDFSESLQAIDFINFSNKETFSLINSDKVEGVVTKIMDEIKEQIVENFKTMKSC